MSADFAVERRNEVEGGRAVPPLRLWFGLAASAIAWASLGVLDIVITWRTCVHQEAFGGPSEHPAARVLYIALAVATILLVLVAGTTSYYNWRALSQQASFLHAKASDRMEFMALLGVFVSITLGMGVLWLSIPPFLLQFCGRAK